MDNAAISIADRSMILRQQLSFRLDSFNSNLLKNYPVKTYCDYLKKYPNVGTYKYVDERIKILCENIIQENDETILELYHQLVVVNLLMEASLKIAVSQLPKTIKEWYRINFETILAKIEKNRIQKGSYLFPQDRFFKDLGVCTMKLIPAGVRKIHLEKVPVKRFLFGHGAGQLLKGLVCILFELKGIQPVFHGHMDSRDRYSLAEFSREGWIRHYKMVAELLKIYTDVKGVIGLAWFYDPCLKAISPELAYLRELVVSNGGKLFSIGTEKSSTENATRLSLKRRKLYEEGKYLPTGYLYIWHRKKIIRWAENELTG